MRFLLFFVVGLQCDFFVARIRFIRFFIMYKSIKKRFRRFYRFLYGWGVVQWLFAIVCYLLIWFVYITSKKQISGLDILKCLATVYYGVHVVDLRTDEVWQFNADERLKKYVPEGPSASVKMDRSMNELVVESQRDAARKFGDLRTVAQRMKGKHTLSGEFIGVHIGWFKQQFICLEADEDGTPVKVIHTVEKIDEQKTAEDVKKAEAAVIAAEKPRS